ncbi:MAG: ArsR family transcriptional regulator [Planctomycetota bacterium]|nr:MAG: ArsR family transcriptional regulator [Planctomycetota bacterium]
MKQFMSITKALSDENRVRILMFLRRGELCVCQIIEMLGLAPSTVSKHMSILYNAGLVESRKAGRWNYYKLAVNANGLVKETIKWVQRSLEKNETVLEDGKRLRAVLKKDLKTCCVIYKN